MTANLRPLQAGLRQAKSDVQSAAAGMATPVGDKSGAFGKGAAAAGAGGLSGITAQLKGVLAPFVALNRVVGGLLGLFARLSFVIGGVVTVLGAIKLASDLATSGSRKAADQIAAITAKIKELRAARSEMLAKEYQDATGIGLDPAMIDKTKARLSEVSLELEAISKRLSDLQLEQARSLTGRPVALLEGSRKALLAEQNILLKEQNELKQQNEKVERTVSEHLKGQLRSAQEKLRIDAEAARIRAIEKFDKIGTGGTTNHSLIQAINILISQRQGRDIR